MIETRIHKGEINTRVAYRLEREDEIIYYNSKLNRIPRKKNVNISFINLQGESGWPQLVVDVIRELQYREKRFKTKISELQAANDQYRELYKDYEKLEGQENDKEKEIVNLRGAVAKVSDELTDTQVRAFKQLLLKDEILNA